jgi:hypothetical protein
MDAIALYAEIQGGTGGYGSYREIDMYDDEPIKFTKSIQEIEEPTATTSNFTRTFRVPADSGNGQYFKAVFNVNSTDFDATKKANAYINVNNAYFVGGNIRLNAIYRNQRRAKIEYEIVFMGETSTFGSVVGPKNMSEINLSDLGHNFNYDNLKLSWNAGPGSTGGLLNGDVVYPLCEWGYDYGDDDQPIQNTVSAYTGTTGGSMKGFTNSGHPLALTQFKPMVRAKKIWDAIFDDAGYTYDSTFLNSMFFSNIYMMSTDSATSQAELITTPYSLIGIPNSGSNSLPFYTFTKIVANNESTDNTNSYDPITSKYTVPFTGYYTIGSLLTVTYISPSATYGGTGGFSTFSYAMYKNGAQVTSRTGHVYPGSGTQTMQAYASFSQGNTSSGSGNVPSPNFYFSGNFVQGDVLEFYVYVSGLQFQFFTISTGSIGFIGPSVVMPQGLMPTQFKQLDFIKGINDKFKLMWEPDKNNPKKFKIEPWVDWIRNGDQKDWTDKLNEQVDVSIKPLFYTQSRRIIFKDSEEADVYNFSYQQANKQSFGQLNQDSNIELITGDRTITSIFAPVPLAPIGATAAFLVPHFAKDTETQRQPMQVKPRLMFYNGLQDVPIAWYMKDAIGPSGATQLQTKYPLASQFSLYPFNANSFDLNWTNSPQFWDPLKNTAIPAGGTGATAFAGATTNTAYTKYWQSWFDSTYDPYSRIMEAEFALDSTDVQDLNFNDLVMVGDSWWNVTKINDYVLGTKQNVKVQLVKLGAVGVSIGATGGANIGGTVLYQFDNICYGYTICGAVCCTSIRKYSIWGNNKDLYASQFFYANPSGSIPAQAGYYSDGTYFYNVNSFGVLTAIGLNSLAGCTCAPTLYAISVCASDTFCTACCCTTYSQTIYGNNASLALCTVLYGDSVGTTTLIPNRYYKNASAQARVGSNGTTITSFGSCSTCNCGGNPNNGVYARAASAPTESTFADPAAACSCTGSEQYETVYTDTEAFVDSSVFYFDTNSTIAIGGTGTTGYISNGEFVKYYVGATASGPTLSCTDFTPVDRTTNIRFVATSETHMDLIANFRYYTCPDPETYLFIDEATYVGLDWIEFHNIDYNPSNFVAVELMVDVPCTIIYQYYQQGIIVDFQKMMLDPGRTYLFQERFPVQDFVTEIYFTFQPA